jgi:hypothetical protein
VSGVLGLFVGMTIVCFLCLLLTGRAAITIWSDYKQGEANWGMGAAGGIALTIAVIAAILAVIAFKAAMRAA